MTKSKIKDALKAEITFFDKAYFNDRTNKEARISFYYTGHGEIGSIKFLDFDVKYRVLIEHIFVELNKHINNIK